jgi:hypothetical protein
MSIEEQLNVMDTDLFKFVTQLSNEYSAAMMKRLTIYLEKRKRTNALPIAYSLLNAMNICSFVNRMEEMFTDKEQYEKFKSSFYTCVAHDIDSLSKAEFELESMH